MTSSHSYRYPHPYIYFPSNSLIIKIKIKQELLLLLFKLRHFDPTINFPCPITAERWNNISVTPYTCKRSNRAGSRVSETCRSHPLFERLSPRGEARECTLPGEIFSSSRLKFIGETTTTTTLSPFHAESGFLVIFARREERGGGGGGTRCKESRWSECLEILHGRISAPVKFAFGGGATCIKRPASSPPTPRGQIWLLAREPPCSQPIVFSSALEGVVRAEKFSIISRFGAGHVLAELLYQNFQREIIGYRY